MLKIDPAITTIGLAAVMAIAGGFGINALAARTSQDTAYAQAATAAPASQWAASATGRVEPKDGEVRIASRSPGRIVEVLAETNDQGLQAGDLILRLDDQDVYAKIAAAVAEVGVRERERDDEKAAPTGVALERRKAEDALDKAERALFAARQAFDTALLKPKAGDANNAEDVTNQRRTENVDAAGARRWLSRRLLAVGAKPNTCPQYQRLKRRSLARAELSSAEIGRLSVCACARLATGRC